MLGLHFDREFRRAVRLTIGLWLMVWGFWAVGEFMAGRRSFVREAPIDVPVIFLKSLVAAMLYPVCFLTRGWPSPRRWTMIVAAVLVAAVLQASLEMVELRLLGRDPSWSPPDWPALRACFVASALNNGYISFATAALLAFQVEVRCSNEQHVRLARAEAAAQRAQTDALRLQLNPHFLFNTLNSISSLMGTSRVTDAEEMLARLSDFLRNSLATTPDRMLTLDEEVDAAETYLQIEQVRFGDRMRIAIRYAPALGDVLIPSFILQPLVENAVKYGVATSRGAVTVGISAEAHDGIIELTVSDDAGPQATTAPAAGLGVGLANTRQRLDLLYGRRACLHAGRVERLYVARLRLPLMRS